MRLRLLWIFASVLLMCLVFSPAPVLATATQCQIHKNSEWRCAKDNYQADTIRIDNKSSRDASFNVDVWTSDCGKKGSRISTKTFVLTAGHPVDEPFQAARANQCLEMFIYNCEPDSCKNILAPHTL